MFSSKQNFARRLTHGVHEEPHDGLAIAVNQHYSCCYYDPAKSSKCLTMDRECIDDYHAWRLTVFIKMLLMTGIVISVIVLLFLASYAHRKYRIKTGQHKPKDEIDRKVQMLNAIKRHQLQDKKTVEGLQIKRERSPSPKPKLNQNTLLQSIIKAELKRTVRQMAETNDLVKEQNRTEAARDLFGSSSSDSKGDSSKTDSQEKDTDQIEEIVEQEPALKLVMQDSGDSDDIEAQMPEDSELPHQPKLLVSPRVTRLQLSNISSMTNMVLASDRTLRSPRTKREMMIEESCIYPVFSSPRADPVQVSFQLPKIASFRGKEEIESETSST